MATPRRNWFRVHDSILREDWDDRTTATVIRLMAWLHQRWWRDGLTLMQASTAHINSLDCMKITGIRRPKEAALFLSRLPLEAGLRSASACLVTIKNTTSVSLDWPKFAECQEVNARKLPERRPPTSPSETETETETKKRREGGLGEAPKAISRSDDPEPSPEAERFIPPAVAGLDVDTLPLKTARDLLAVQPRGAAETPDTLATWFAYIAPVMRLRGIRDLPRAARKWWPRLRREDVEKARSWLQVQRIEQHRAQAPTPPVEEPTAADTAAFAELLAARTTVVGEKRH